MTITYTFYEFCNGLFGRTIVDSGKLHSTFVHSEARQLYLSWCSLFTARVVLRFHRCSPLAALDKSICHNQFGSIERFAAMWVMAAPHVLQKTRNRTPEDRVCHSAESPHNALCPLDTLSKREKNARLVQVYYKLLIWLNFTKINLFWVKSSL